MTARTGRVARRYWMAVMFTGGGVDGEHEVDGDHENVHPGAPLFFISYARPDSRQRSSTPQRRRIRHFIQFYEDLSENVAQLVSRQAGSDPGFIDQSIPGGSDWSQEVLQALGTCQIFIPLLSEPYVTSPWCAMEWHAFSQRQATRKDRTGPSAQTPIIPVTWAPMASGLLPPAVHKIQRFSPSRLDKVDISAKYEADGVFGLMRTGRRDPYKGIVWQLALRIAQFHYTYQVESREFNITELRNIFQEHQL